MRNRKCFRVNTDNQGYANTDDAIPQQMKVRITFYKNIICYEVIVTLLSAYLGSILVTRVLVLILK